MPNIAGAGMHVNANPVHLTTVILPQQAAMTTAQVGKSADLRPSAADTVQLHSNRSSPGEDTVDERFITAGQPSVSMLVVNRAGT